MSYLAAANRLGSVTTSVASSRTVSATPGVSIVRELALRSIWIDPWLSIRISWPCAADSATT